MPRVSNRSAASTTTVSANGRAITMPLRAWGVGTISATMTWPLHLKLSARGSVEETSILDSLPRRLPIWPAKFRGCRKCCRCADAGEWRNQQGDRALSGHDRPSSTLLQAAHQIEKALEDAPETSSKRHGHRLRASWWKSMQRFARPSRSSIRPVAEPAALSPGASGTLILHLGGNAGTAVVGADIRLPEGLSANV